jgi:TonB family protein
MRGALIFSFLAHIAIVGLLFLGGSGYSSEQADPEVYRVRLVSGVLVPPGKTGPAVNEKVEKGNVIPAPPIEVKKVKPKKKGEGAKVEKKEVSRRPKVRDEGGEGGGTGVGGLELEGEEFPFPYYLELFVNKIRSNWKNPIQGTETMISAQVYFKISRTGRITGVALKKGSGNFIYDQAAVRAVLASNPLPPLPEGYSGESLGVTCDIIP